VLALLIYVGDMANRDRARERTVPDAASPSSIDRRFLTDAARDAARDAVPDAAEE